MCEYWMLFMVGLDLRPAYWFEAIASQISVPQPTPFRERDPLTDIDLIADPAKNFTLVMKNGLIYKGAR
jgi:hypothetical protein